MEIKEHEARCNNAMKIRIGWLPEEWYKQEDSFEDTLAKIKATMPNVTGT